MRQFSIDLTKTLANGLRRSYRERINAPILDACMNGRPYESGLSAYNPFYTPLTAFPVSFPFPMLFRGRDITLLADETAIYRVDEASWNTYALDIEDAYNPGNPGTITRGGAWQFLDFGRVWSLYNGRSQVFRTNVAGYAGGDDAFFVQNNILIEAACRFDGRVVIGGFDPSNFWNTGWSELRSSWAEQWHPDISPSDRMDANFILWSSVGQSDMAFLWLIYPEIAKYGLIDPASGTVHDDEKMLLMECFRRNEWGIMQMPWSGKVRAIKTLGDFCIVYGDGGVTIMQSGGVPRQLGVKRTLTDTGIMSRGAVGGDENVHCFVDTIGYLHIITANLEHKRIGYLEFLGQMKGKDVNVSYNSIEQEFIISTSDNSFLYTVDGLGEIGEAVTSCIVSSGRAVGITTPIATSALEFWTGAQDMGIRAIKTVDSLEIDADSPYPVKSALQFRNRKSESFRTTPWVPVGPEGKSINTCGGVEFKIGYKVVPFKGFHARGITVRFKVNDVRGIRGAYGARDPASAD